MNLEKIEHSPIIVEKLEGDKWKIAEELVIRLKLEKEGVIGLRCKKGFIFNFRSGSRFLNASIPKIDDFAIVWAMHDIGYTVHVLSRKIWDELMYQGLKLKGLSTWKSWCAYKGVRWGGESAWCNVDDENYSKCSIVWNDK